MTARAVAYSYNDAVSESDLSVGLFVATLPECGRNYAAAPR